MTDPELIVLGLLSQGAHHAYELEQEVRARRLREWTAVAFSSLYYLLHRAEKQGWVRSREQEGKRGPATRRYRLTAAGRRELRAAVLARLRLPSTANAADLAVMFAGAVPMPEFRAALVNFAAENRKAAADARERHAWMPDSPYRVFGDVIFDHAIARFEADAAWAERAAEAFRPWSGQ